VVERGRIKALGNASALLPTLPADVELVTFENSLLLPGFIDTHVHYPQAPIIGAQGEQLLNWLENYTFPAEMRFADYDYAFSVAEFFLDQLLRNGTTTALVFATVHKTSVDAFFEAAQARQLRMVAGKVLMDCHAPAALLDGPNLGILDTETLIERWHGHQRLSYAVTPRFAATSTREQLQAAGDLLASDPSLLLHTHLSENEAEVKWIKELFPESRNYLDVYQRYGLVGDQSVFAHSIHLSDAEWRCLGERQAAVSHCPSSNLFLGSGLFNLSRCEEHGVAVGVGTDVGAGTSLSLLQTLNDAYKVQQLQQRALSPLKAFYLATLGGARALSLDHCIGNFESGKEADFCVLNLKATEMLDFRMNYCQTLEEKLAVLMTLGDDRLVAATYVLGQRAYCTSSS